MEIVWIIIGSLFIVAGVLGAFLPVLPGPPLGYVGLLIMQFTMGYPFTWLFLLIWGVIVGVVVTLDSFVPAEGARRMGGSKYGIYGSLIGGLLGLFFFAPLGLIVGPIVGAFVGELVAGRKSGSALKAAMGSFVGLMVAMALKAGVTLVFAYYFFSNI